MDTSEAHAILGTTPGATPQAIRAAFRRRARERHPDLNPGDKSAAADFNAIRLAYVRLTGAGRPDAEAAPPAQAARRRGADVHAVLEIPLELAARGGPALVRADPAAPCGACGATGRVPLETPTSCGACGGAGTHKRTRGIFRVSSECPACKGRGMVDTCDCAACAGSGRNPLGGDVEVVVPAGAADGLVIHMPGRGGSGTGGGVPGDLRVTVRVAAHRDFRRRGDDLLTKVAVSYADACLGGTVRVRTLGGDAVAAVVPPGTQPGHVITLPGHGMPDGFGKRGSLLAQVQVHVPRAITPEQKALLERWRALEKAGGAMPGPT